ncbi:MAG: PHP domain-containing protein [bacterium]|nr:PHP domain-containing protein [bacterium]
MNVDLHLHSNYSDGSDSVEELVEKLRNGDIKIFALTDHDTVCGCQEIVQKKLAKDIKFVQGIELTCSGNGVNCHLLGYNCDINNQTLTGLINKGKKLRRIKLDKRIKYLKDVWNIDLTQNEIDWLYSRESVVKTHIANVLVNRGLAQDNLSAMKKYLDGCKTEKTRFSIDEAIDAIITSGGIPVFAHPLGGEGEKHYTPNEFMPILSKMINYGIKGLECYYSRYTAEEATFLVECANRFNLFISGGSDYHGFNKDISIGRLSSDGSIVQSEQLTIIQEF